MVAGFFGRYSLTFLSIVIYTLAIIAMTAYLVIRPRPLIWRAPAYSGGATRVDGAGPSSASQMVVGWIWQISWWEASRQSPWG